MSVKPKSKKPMLTKSKESHGFKLQPWAAPTTHRTSVVGDIKARKNKTVFSVDMKVCSVNRFFKFDRTNVAP